MRRILLVVGLLLVGLWVASPAQAASSVSLTLSTTAVAPGGVVHVSGHCEASTSGEVISHAFLHDAGHDFAGVGAVAFTTDGAGRFTVVATVPASRALGTYRVTARCGGGALGITRTLRVTTLAHTGATSAPLGLLGMALLGCGVVLVTTARRRRPA